MGKSPFRSRPSKTHIIWTRQTRNGATRKRLDEKHLEKWASHCGFDFDTTTRVDHDRSDDPRKQFRVVFRWGEMDQETIAFGDEEWDLGTQKTPRTFIEVDEGGLARVRGWNFETIFDVREMRHKGPELLIRTASDDTKRLNGRKFVQNPRQRQRDGA